MTLKGKTSVERAVLTVALPGVADVTPGVESLDRIAHFSLTQLHQRIVPDEIGLFAAEIVRHRFYIDGRLCGAHFVSFAFVPEADRRSANRNDFAERRGVTALERFDDGDFLIVIG